MKDDRTQLVYSTQQSILRKGKPRKEATHNDAAPTQQKVTVRIDRKGRCGKSVSVVEGLQMPELEKDVLLKQFKARLGTGGVLKDGSLEIQGDHCAAIMQCLQNLGYRPKRSGG